MTHKKQITIARSLTLTHFELMKVGVRVFVENKTAGDFGFVIYSKTNDAGKPWERHSHFTEHYPTYVLALDAGIKAGKKLHRKIRT